MKKYPLGLIFWATVGLGVGLLMIHWRPANTVYSQPDVALPDPLPSAIHELVASSDVIIVGTVGEIVNQEIVYGYGPEAEALAELDKQTSTLLGLPMLDYQIIIDEVIWGNDKIRAGGHLLYRLPGAFNRDLRDPNVISQGETKLLFLTANPDGQTYGVTSFMHMMTIEEANITYYFEGEDLAPFDIHNADMFLDLVREAIAQHR